VLQLTLGVWLCWSWADFSQSDTDDSLIICKSLSMPQLGLLLMGLGLLSSSIEMRTDTFPSGLVNLMALEISADIIWNRKQNTHTYTNN
jgi:hypothetical protein